MPTTLIVKSDAPDNRRHRDTIARWVAAGLIAPADTRVLDDDELADRHFAAALRDGAALLCLIGERSSRCEELSQRLDLAARLGARIILVRVPGTRGRAPLEHRGRPLCPLDPSLLRQLLDPTRWGALRRCARPESACSTPDASA